jgi:microcompartment protein CcmK/EutM
MFLARVEGTVVATAKHPSLGGCRFVVVRRLEADGTVSAEPNVVVDWLGAARGNTVMVSTDGDIARERFGNHTPARMVVVGIVDAVQQPEAGGDGSSTLRPEQSGAPNDGSMSLRRKQPDTKKSPA